MSIPTRVLVRTGVIIGLSLCAGGGDLATGLLLIVAPEMTLRLMRVPVPHELVFLRFVGCFGWPYLQASTCEYRQCKEERAKGRRQGRRNEITAGEERYSKQIAQEEGG